MFISKPINTQTSKSARNQPQPSETPPKTSGDSTKIQHRIHLSSFLKISPTVVLIMSLCFIGFVTALHIFGKFYRRSATAAA